MCPSRPNPTFILLGGAVAAGTALAGFGLYHGRPGALIPSLVAQALQAVGFNIGTGVYQLTLGPCVDAVIVWGQRASINIGFTPRIVVWFNGPTERVPSPSIFSRVGASGDYSGPSLSRYVPWR